VRPAIREEVPPAPEEGWISEEEFKKDLVCVDLSHPDNPQGGLPVDTTDPKRMYIDVSDKHNLIISSSGTGKSRRLIMQYLLSLQGNMGSAMVVDTKGELYRKTAGRLEASGKKVYVLNLREPRKSCGWNMFSRVFEKYNSGDPDQKDDAISTLMEVSKMLFPLNPKASDPYWDLAGQSFLCGMAWETLKRAKSPDDMTLRSIAHLIDRNFGSDEDISKFSRSIETGSLQQMMLSSVLVNAESTRRCVLSEVRSHLSPFIQSESLSDMLGDDDLRFEDIIKQPSIVYLIIPDETRSMGPLAAIFIKLLYQCLIEQAYANGGALDNTFHMVIDEAANLGAIENLPSMLSACRSRNIRITQVYQSFGQIENLYGSDAETLKGNSPNMVYIFSRDKLTLSEISFLLGKKRNGSDVMSITDLQQLDEATGEAIVLRARKKPYRAHFSDISKFDIELDLPVPEITPRARKKKAPTKTDKDESEAILFPELASEIDLFEKRSGMRLEDFEYDAEEVFEEALLDIGYDVSSAETFETTVKMSVVFNLMGDPEPDPKTVDSFLEAITKHEGDAMRVELRLLGLRFPDNERSKIMMMIDDIKSNIKKNRGH